MKRKKPQSKPERKVQDSVHVMQLSSYTAPRVMEDSRDKWVAYGEDNNYFQYLIDRYNGSPTSNAAINGISEMIYGRGLDAVDEEANESDVDLMKELFKKDCVKEGML